RCGLAASIDWGSARRRSSAAVLRHHFEAQHADHLAGFGHHPHAPFADRLFGEVLLVGPGPITGLSAAADIEGDTVDTAPVVHPFVIDALLEATWRIDGGVGVEIGRAHV